MPREVTLHDLKGVLDDKALQDLKDNFSGCRIFIPKKRSVLMFGSTEERNRYIWNMYFENGSSEQEIGEKIDMNPDSVKRIIRQMFQECR